jgi:hypothetical protein
MMFVRELQMKSILRAIVFSVIAVAFAACTARTDRSAIENLKNVAILAAIVLGIIVTIIIVYKATKNLGLIGVFLGLILGAAVILSVPLEVQYAIIGGILGLGGDFAASKSRGKPSTMIESLSSFIVSATQAANRVANETELEHEKVRVSQLIWSTIGTIALMLIVGRILSGIA